MLIVVTGGSGSGKSAYAEQLVLEQGDYRRYYIATMRPWDEECVKKIERHKTMRAAKQFETVECYEDLHKVSPEPNSVILLECMSNLVADEFYREEADRFHVAEHIMKGVDHLLERAKALILVTNEVFSDGVVYDEETDAYERVLALLNRELARRADRAIEVVYGIPITIREEHAGCNEYMQITTNKGENL